MSKYNCHIPVESFGFISVEVEGGPEDALEAYRAVKGQLGANPGLPQAAWNTWLDGYLNGKPGTIDEWNEMNEMQKTLINEIKKSKKRNTK